MPRFYKGKQAVVRTINVLFESLLYLFLVFLPMAFGSATRWGELIACSFVFLMALLWLAKAFFEQKFLISPLLTPYLPFFILLFIGILHLIPLPALWLKAVSPGGYHILTIALGDFQFHPLTVSPGATRETLFYLFTSLCLLFLSIQFFDKKERVIRVTRFFILFGFGLAVFSMLQMLQGHGKIYWFLELTEGSMPFGPFVSRNHYASYIGLLALVGGTFLFFPIRGIQIRPHLKQIFSGIFSEATFRWCLLFFFLTFMILSLFYTTSRGGQAAFLITILLLALLLATWQKKRFLVFCLGTIIFLYVVYWGIEKIAPTLIIARWHNFLNQGLMDDRFQTWKDIVPLLTNFPLLGTGLNAFSSAFHHWRTIEWEEFWGYAHNDPLQLLSEIGMIGGIFFFGSCLLITQKIWQSIRKTSSSVTQIFLLGSLGALLFVALHSLVDFPFRISSVAMTWVVILGMAWGMISRDLKKQKLIKTTEFSEKIGQMMSCSLFIVLFVFFLVPSLHKAYADYRVWRIDELSLSQQISRLREAAQTDPSNILYHRRLGIALMQQAATASNLIQRRPLLREALKHFQQEIAWNPVHGFSHYRVAAATYHLHEKDKGILVSELQKALNLNPRSRLLKYRIRTYLPQYSYLVDKIEVARRSIKL